MTGDADAHPDRPPPARPFRVARFDALPPDDGVSDDEAGERRIARLDRVDDGDGPSTRVAPLDGLDRADSSSTRVAGFDGLDDAPAAPAPVAPLDAPGRSRQTARPRRPASTGSDRRPDTRPPADDRLDGLRPDTAPQPDAAPDSNGPATTDPVPTDPVPTDPGDGIPPDGPLPRGRRRGARAGRLGPDAPDPDAPEPAADPVAAARDICLRLLTDRARTRQELAQALARKGVPAEASATVLDRFDEVGLIDDAAFAGQWVRSRHTGRGLGRRAIAVELRRKGVADDVAGEALAEVDAESEARRARELVDRKLRSLAVDTAERRAAAGRRLVGMLARKGYGAGTAYRVVREALADRGAEIDELGAAEPHDD